MAQRYTFLFSLLRDGLAEASQKWVTPLPRAGGESHCAAKANPPDGIEVPRCSRPCQ